MAAVMFDTQKFVERLEAAKFPPEQAKAQSEAMREVLETAFASHAKEQQDISARTVETLDSKTEKALLALKHETNEHSVKTDAKIDKLEAKVDSQALALRKDLSAVEERLNSKVSNLEIGLRKDLSAVEERLNGKISNLETGLRKDLSVVEERLNSKMSNLEIGLRKDMEALGNKLIIRLTLAMLGVLGVVGTIAGFVLRAMMMK